MKKKGKDAVQYNTQKPTLKISDKPNKDELKQTEQAKRSGKNRGWLF